MEGEHKIGCIIDSLLLNREFMQINPFVFYYFIFILLKSLNSYQSLYIIFASLLWCDLNDMSHFMLQRIQ